MMIKEQEDTKEEELISYFKEADVILLEGFKNSDYPKLEIIRKGNSYKSVCKKETLLAIVSDMDYNEELIKTLDLNDIDKIAEFLLEYIGECGI